MNLSLKPEQADFIQSQVSAGNFSSPEDLIAEALLLLEKRKAYDAWAEDVKQKIEAAAASLDRGEGVDGEIVVARLKEKFRRAREQG
jgi:antitoxin ParD1/3/4